MSNSNGRVSLMGQGLISGTDLDERITGSNDVDVINAGGGCDIVFAGERGDRIDGQNGDDVLYGEDGDDEIAGGDDNDYLFGGLGIDDLNGEDGNDVLIGGAGSDRLVGGDNVLDDIEDVDNDYLVGTDYSNAGVREIDFLKGGADADTFVLAETRSIVKDSAPDGHRQDEVTGQTVQQKAYYLDNTLSTNSYAIIEDFQPNTGDKIQLLEPIESTTQPFTYSAAPVTINRRQEQGIFLRTSPTSEPDLIAVVRFGINGDIDRTLNLNSRYMSYISQTSDVETILGTEDDDALYGTSEEDFISGKEGDDIIQGGTGSDQLYGGPGTDTLVGANPYLPTPADEIDRLTGNEGRDRFVLGIGSYSSAGFRAGGATPRVLYDDNINVSSGSFSYAYIKDFDPSEDQIQLRGSVNDYQFIRRSINGINGTRIYYTTNQITPELIGFVASVNPGALDTSLFSGQFVWV